MANLLTNNRGTNLTSSPPQAPPNIPDEEKHDKPPDSNMSNPRLLVNRESIYERQLPGDAYITVYVQRLQHGYYASSAVSDTEAEYVDFLALSFVFHSPHTLSHRFKSATVRASIQGPDQLGKGTKFSLNYPRRNPRILMHAPHLIYGTVSPETMEWTFSLAGSIGVSETPISANLIPSGSVNGRYRRYEMMRIQGSARTWKSPRGPEFDIESGEVVWSLEENNLQRSGLPREFTFVMLIQKQDPFSDIKLSLEIDPVIQSWWGSYPSWVMGLSAYRPTKWCDVNFKKEVGQRFEPVDGERGFNFAALVSQFDDYIALPGRKYSRRMEIPKETDLPEHQGFRQGYPGQYGSLNPMLGIQGMQGIQGIQGSQGMEQRYQMQNTETPPSLAPFTTTTAPTLTTTTSNLTGINAQSNNLNVSLGPSHGVAIMNLSALRSAMASPRAFQPPTNTNTNTNTNNNLNSDTTLVNRTSGERPGPGEWPYPLETGPGIEIETIRSRMLRTVHWSTPPENRSTSNDAAEDANNDYDDEDKHDGTGETSSVMNMKNRPLTPSLLSLEDDSE